MENKSDLLEKYWQAESSLEEESALKSLLENEARETDYLTAYFQISQAYKTIAPSNSLDEKLARISSESASGTGRTFRMPLRAVAASLFVLVTCGFLAYQYSAYKQNQFLYTDTYQNPEQAWQAMRTAIGNVSEHLDNGTELLTAELIRINEIQEFEQ
jgi:hypothetical protein